MLVWQNKVILHKMLVDIQNYLLFQQAFSCLSYKQGNLLYQCEMNNPNIKMPVWQNKY